MEQQDDIRQAPGRTLAILGVGTLAFVLAQTTVIPALGRDAEGARRVRQRDRLDGHRVPARRLDRDADLRQARRHVRQGALAGRSRWRRSRSAPWSARSSDSLGADDRRPRSAGPRRRRVPALASGSSATSSRPTRSRPASRCSARSPRSAPASACRSAACSPTAPATTGSSGSPRSWACWPRSRRSSSCPSRPIRTPGRVDFVGAGILAVGLTALLIAISRGADWGWGSAADARPDRRPASSCSSLFGVFEAPAHRRRW